MRLGTAQPRSALKLRIRIGPLRVPLWVFTLAAMSVAAVAGQAIGPLDRGTGADTPSTADGVAGSTPDSGQPAGPPIASPPVVRMKLTAPGRTTSVEFYNAGRECDLRIETVHLAAEGWVESTRIDRYSDRACDGRVESVLFDGFLDRDQRSEAFFQERDREYADWLRRLGVR